MFESIRLRKGTAPQVKSPNPVQFLAWMQKVGEYIFAPPPEPDVVVVIYQ
jgi:hypothetical protein